MFIERITLKCFSGLHKIGINASTKLCQRHALFHYFLSYDSKKYDATTTAHSKHFISLLKEKSIGVIIKYSIGKYQWLCRAINFCLVTIPYVIYVAMLLI